MNRRAIQKIFLMLFNFYSFLIFSQQNITKVNILDKNIFTKDVTIEKRLNNIYTKAFDGYAYE